jgi:hypothetical protein
MSGVESLTLSSLPTYDENRHVNAIVEAPKDFVIKLKYDVKFGVFTIWRALPMGLSYPAIGASFRVGPDYLLQVRP